MALMFLSSLPFYTYKKEDIITEALGGDIAKIFSLTIDDKNTLKQLLSNEDFATFINMLEEFDAEKFEQNLNSRNIFCITYLDDNYPEILSLLSDPPRTIYYTGDLSLIGTKSLAVVGTRMPTSYGKLVTEKIVKDVADSGITIVSGMASGIDKISHESALKVNGKTIAVMGTGFNHIYPAMNIDLARQIAEKGLIITEYHPDVKATKYTFPARNRIIACLAEGVLIPEAGFKSGTIYTKDYALELGKEIYAVPGSILSEKSNLPNVLIKSGQCNVVTEADDILIKYGLKKAKVKQQKVNQLTIEEQTIVNCLKQGEKSFDEIIDSTKIPIKNLSSYLTTLEIRGIITKLQNNFYILMQ